MACTIRIYDRHGLSPEKVAALSGLCSGWRDQAYVLHPGTGRDELVLYDGAHFGRGIETSFPDGFVQLDLALPASSQEIHSLFSLARTLCTHLSRRNALVNGEPVSVEDFDMLETDTLSLSVSALKRMKAVIASSGRVYVTGALYPIALGRKQAALFDSLDSFSAYLHSLQDQDVCYASPQISQVHGRRTGCYYLAAGVSTVLPVVPSAVFSHPSVSQWKVFAQGMKQAVPFEEFMASVRSVPFDDCHVVVLWNG